VGKAWRLTEAPSLAGAAAQPPAADPELQKLLDELHNLDAKADKIQQTTGANPEAVRYYVARAELIGRIMAKDKQDPTTLEQWLRQQAECLASAAQNSPANDPAAYQRLRQLAQQVAKDYP